MANSYQNKKKNPISIYIWVLVGIIVLGAAAVLALRPQAPAAEQTALPDEVSVAQAAELRDQGAFILDVRENSEWQELHVPDSTLIPLASLAGRLDEVPKDRQVVVICRSGNRSAQGRDILRQAGYENVTSVAGGITQWKAAGFPTISGQ